MKEEGGDHAPLRSSNSWVNVNTPCQASQPSIAAYAKTGQKPDVVNPNVLPPANRCSIISALGFSYFCPAWLALSIYILTQPAFLCQYGLPLFPDDHSQGLWAFTMSFMKARTCSFWPALCLFRCGKPAVRRVSHGHPDPPYGYPSLDQLFLSILPSKALWFSNPG